VHRWISGNGASGVGEYTVPKSNVEKIILGTSPILRQLKLVNLQLLSSCTANIFKVGKSL
jgi:hypothetical protein